MLCWLCATLSDEGKPSLIYCPQCVKVNEWLGSEELAFTGRFIGYRFTNVEPNKPFLTAADLIMLREMKISL